MAGKIPGSQGKHRHQHFSKSPPAQALRGHVDARPAGTPQLVHQQDDFHMPPADGIIRVRYVWARSGQPMCEVWKHGQRVYPPPGLVSRADPKKDTSWLCEGDTIYHGSVSTSQLRDLGFDDPGKNIFTALLFFLMDIDSDEKYRVVFVIKKIVPDMHDQWSGGVIFRRCLVAGSTIVPFPRQGEYPEDFAVDLIYKDLAEELGFLQMVLQAVTGFYLDLLWGLTGGWEAKVAAEVGEKYVAHEVLRRAIKYIKPKFLLILRAYLTGFIKEMASQYFHLYMLMLRTAAANRLMTSVGGGGSITVDQLHYLQSSSQLVKDADKADIKWAECHKKGMAEALTPFWALFRGNAIAMGPLNRVINTFFKYLETFFFDLGLLRVVTPVGSLIGGKIRELIAGATADWLKDALGSPQGVKSDAAEKKLTDFTLKKLTDGSLVDFAWQYVSAHWDEWAKKACDAAKDKLIEEMRGVIKQELGKS